MESGLPMLNCLLQKTLRSLCTHSDSSSSCSSSKWVYAVFWRVLPRNYPPPKWDHGGGILDRAKGNKRNWILVWEDGFCDFWECEQAGSGRIKGRFGADIFFKMSHEVYSFGEGLMGKVAADNSHKWVFRDSPSEKDSANLISSWNVSLEPQPRAWEAQFRSGVQTIAIISVREGIIQLGSFGQVAEDLNLVISIQRRFSYLQSIPGIYAIQRPYLATQHPHTFKPISPHLLMMMETNEASHGIEDSRQLAGSKRLYCEPPENFPMKSVNLGFNSPQTGIFAGPAHLWSIPPLQASKSGSQGAPQPKEPCIASADESLDDHVLSNLRSSGDESIGREVRNPDVKMGALYAPETARDVTLDSLASYSGSMKIKFGLESALKGGCYQYSKS